MDVMKIKSEFLTSVLSKCISKIIKNKTGIDCLVSVDELTITNDAYDIKIQTKIEASMKTSKLSDLLNKII